MTTDAPLAFIGSSSEARDRGIVDALIQAIDTAASCTPWYQDDEFSTKGSTTTFSALCSAANNYDFAIFLLTNDDVVTSRRKKRNAPRDNVVFELGLFAAAIGAERVYGLVEGGADLKLPSDLQGVNLPRFSPADADQKQQLAELNRVTRGVVQGIRQLSFRRIDLQLIETWRYRTDDSVLEVYLSSSKITRARDVIGDWRICIAARIADSRQVFEHDTAIVYSSPVVLPDIIDSNLLVEIPEDALAANSDRKVEPESKIEGRAVLLPPGEELKDSPTLAEAVGRRCRDVERFSYQLAGSFG